MKTTAESLFDKVIKDCFHKKLKPLGFKKKGNNFYLQLKELGQIINIQKSSYGSKTDISFTINTGIFSPEYFLAYYTYETKVPDYPTESSCAVRRRIGKLRGENDMWYEISDDTNEQTLLAQMHENLDHYILPYFKQMSTKELFLQALDTLPINLSMLEKLLLYTVLKDIEKAKKEYEYILHHTSNIRILNDAKSLMAKYGMD